MLGNLFNKLHSNKENQESKAKHGFLLKKDNKKDKNKKVR